MGPTVLVVGGAGYIGAHAAKLLKESGYSPVVFDNLTRGHADFVKWGEFVNADLADKNAIRAALEKYRPLAVMHFAAYALVGESMENPGLYYRNNVANTLNLLEAMVEVDCRRFIFSSTCATYGEPEEIPITERHPQRPVNPYGWSKLMVERMLADFEAAHGLANVNLRYFNAAGADPDCEIGERHDPETHLIPLVIHAASGKKPDIAVFGDDYPTPDGTCVRDYIHVTDLAQAHLLALERLLDGKPGNSYNLGNGSGYSVLEVIREVERVSGRKVNARLAPRRRGDPARLVGSSELITRELGFKPRFASLTSIVETAWKWHLRSGS